MNWKLLSGFRHWVGKSFPGSLPAMLMPAMLLFLLTLIPGQPVLAAGDRIRLIATGSDRAIIEINGERLVLSTDNPEQQGATLVSSNSDEVVILYQGLEFTLTTQDHSALIYDGNIPDTSESGKSAVIWADATGFFFADGEVNGRPARFLVDTGADIVTFSSIHADQLGIDYSRGRNGYASTASGITAVKSLRLDQLSIEGITLYDVEISVIQGAFPAVPLLGGTFLNQLNMSRVGNRMELTRP